MLLWCMVGCGSFPVFLTPLVHHLPEIFAVTATVKSARNLHMCSWLCASPEIIWPSLMTYRLSPHELEPVNSFAATGTSHSTKDRAKAGSSWFVSVKAPTENAQMTYTSGDSRKQFHTLIAHDCGYPLSRYTCRATRVAADFLDFKAFCRCNSGVAPNPLKILVSHLPPPRPPHSREVSHPKFGSEKVSRYTGVSQVELRVVALHRATQFHASPISRAPQRRDTAGLASPATGCHNHYRLSYLAMEKLQAIADGASSLHITGSRTTASNKGVKLVSVWVKFGGAAASAELWNCCNTAA